MLTELSAAITLTWIPFDYGWKLKMLHCFTINTFCVSWSEHIRPEYIRRHLSYLWLLWASTIHSLIHLHKKCPGYSGSSTPQGSAAKLAALSREPENLKKLLLNAYLQIFATKMPYLQIFATQMPYLQVFATKIALLNNMTKTQCLALILSVQDEINQLIAHLLNW